MLGDGDDKACDCLEALFARELSHRAANTLQQAIAAVHLSRRGGDDLDAATKRLSAAASLHRALDGSSQGLVDAGAPIRDVCLAVAAAAGADDDVGIVVDAVPLLVDARTLRPMLMISAELVGNSVKHAFTEGRGTITVTLMDDGWNTQLVITDDGTCSGWWRPDGQGCGIVDALARSQGGQVIRTRTAGGSSRVAISVPSLAAAALEPGGSV